MKTTCTIQLFRRYSSYYFLILILLFSASNFTYAQSKWNADAVGGTTDWNTASNWILGVPTSTTNAVISNCTICPVIGNSGNQARSIKIQNGGSLEVADGGGLSVVNSAVDGIKVFPSATLSITSGGNLAIQNGAKNGISNEGTLSNAGNILIQQCPTGINNYFGEVTNSACITVNGALLKYGIKNYGNFDNEGDIDIQNANNDGIHQAAGNFQNGTNAHIHITHSGSNALYNKTTFDNDGTVDIVNANNGIYNTAATFNNNADGVVNIEANTFLNNGVLNLAATFNNNGELNIADAASDGIQNSSSSSAFHNLGLLTIRSGAGSGIFNSGGSAFTNHSCSGIVTENVITNYATFVNDGFIVETASGNSSINTNNSTVFNLNGGTFSIGSGASASTNFDNTKWTGCHSTDWGDPLNWTTLAVPDNQNVLIMATPLILNYPIVSKAEPKVKLISIDYNANIRVADKGELLGESMGVLGDLNIDIAGMVHIDGDILIVDHIHNEGLLTANGIFNGSGSLANTFTGILILESYYKGGNAQSILNDGTLIINDGYFNLSEGSLTNNGTLEITTITPPNPSSFNGLRVGLYNFINGLGAEVIITGGGISTSDFGTVINDGSIHVLNSPESGIKNNTTQNSPFTNRGHIVIENPATNGIENNGAFINELCALIETDGNIVNTDSFINNGTIIEESSDNSSISENNGTVYNLNGGNFAKGSGNSPLTNPDFVVWTGCESTNWADAGNWSKGSVPSGTDVVFIFDVSETTNNIPTINSVVPSIEAMSLEYMSAMHIQAGGEFNANTSRLLGDITIDQSGSMHIAGTLEIFPSKVDNAGTITANYITHIAGKIHNFPTGHITSNTGIASQSTTFNEGTIIINDGFFSNGISNLTNSGLIDITSTSGLFALESGLSGIINNGTGQINIHGNQVKLFYAGLSNYGTINITNSLGNGIEVSSCQLMNYGTINIDNSANDGIHALVGGSIINEGDFFISNSGDDGLSRISNGFVENSGTLSILQSGGRAVFNDANSVFTNETCGTLIVDHVLHNTGGTFTNDGFLKTTFTANNTNTFTNNGVVEDFADSFLGAGLTNNEIVAKPIFGTPNLPIANALQSVNTGNFAVSSLWYSDAALTISAGNYNQTTNEFTHGLTEGVHTIYMQITDVVNACAKVVSIEINILGDEGPTKRGALEAPKANFLSHYPNPVETFTQIQFHLAEQSQAILVLYNFKGQAIREIFKGELKAEEERKIYFDASDLSSGSYFLQLHTPSGVIATTKMLKLE